MQRLSTLTAMTAGQAKRFACDESGATAIEYAMIASGISIAIIAAVMSLGSTTAGMYNSVQTALK